MSRIQFKCAIEPTDYLEFDTEANDDITLVIIEHLDVETNQSLVVLSPEDARSLSDAILAYLDGQ